MRLRVRKPGVVRPTMETPPRRSHLASFLDDEPKRAKSTTGVRERRLTPYQIAYRDAEDRAKSGEWDDARPSSLVGLYSLFHKKIYGVEPLDLEANRELAIATRACSALMSRHFDDDPTRVAEFIRWAFKKEKGMIEWKKARDIQITRIAWRFLFSNSKVSDYRVEMSNRGMK